MATWSIDSIRDTGVHPVIGKAAPRIFRAMMRVRHGQQELGDGFARFLGLATRAELDATHERIARLEGKLKRLERERREARGS